MLSTRYNSMNISRFLPNRNAESFISIFKFVLLLLNKNDVTHFLFSGHVPFSSYLEDTCIMYL